MSPKLRKRKKPFSLANVLVLVAITSYLGIFAFPFGVGNTLMQISLLSLTLGCLLLVCSQWEDWKPYEHAGCLLVFILYAILAYFILASSHLILSAIAAR